MKRHLILVVLFIIFVVFFFVVIDWVGTPKKSHPLVGAWIDTTPGAPNFMVFEANEDYVWKGRRYGNPYVRFTTTSWYKIDRRRKLTITRVKGMERDEQYYIERCDDEMLVLYSESNPNAATMRLKRSTKEAVEAMERSWNDDYQKR